MVCLDATPSGALHSASKRKEREKERNLRKMERRICGQREEGFAFGVIHNGLFGEHGACQMSRHQHHMAIMKTLRLEKKVEQ